MYNIPTSRAQVKRPHPYDVLADADVDRATWLDARAKIIGSSDVPIVLGMHGESRRIEFWYEKAGLIARSDAADEFEGAQMGHRTEPLNAELFAEKTGRKLRREQKLLRSLRYPWLGATLDYTQRLSETGPSAPVELKSTGGKHNWPEDEADILFPDIEFVGEPSLRFQAQLQTQLLVYGAEWGSISVLLGSPYLHHRCADFPAHAGMQAMILAKTRAFHESLEQGVPPDPDGSELVHATLTRRARRAASGVVRVLPEEALDWDRRLTAARAKLAAAERERNLMESSLLTVMGDAESGVLPNGITYSVERRPRRGYTVEPTTTVTLRRVS